jgi:peptidoglycan/LPS O-acetylase OafA/YrhL
VFGGIKGLSNGTGAVVGFFVISGFVLARSLEANADPSRYFRHRIFRLFPAAITVVALFTALHQWFGIYVANEGDFRPGNVILNMLMIRTDINAVMWSMKVECVATPVILLSVWLVQRNGASWLWAIIAVKPDCRHTALDRRHRGALVGSCFLLSRHAKATPRPC